MGSSPVRLTQALLITPSHPTPSSILTLSAIDSQLFLRFSIEYLFIYRPRPRPTPPPDSLSASLKAALATALVPYFPLAGRVRAAPDGSCLQVVCRAQGALFIEAVSDSYSSTDFQKPPKSLTHWTELLSLHVPDVLDGSPPLVLQLTWLNDGSAALAVGINHCICDGIGSAQFLNHFAHLARSSVLVEPKPKPVWDRHLLNPTHALTTSPTIHLLHHPEFVRVPDLCGFMNRVSTDLKPTSVTFDAARLKELKSIAVATSETTSYTSFEALAGHVWRSWARALGFPPNQRLKLLFSINIRSRVKPGIPEGYYGNAFVLGCAESSAKELGERGIGYGSGLVRRGKERVEKEHVRRVSELVSEWRASPDSVGVLIVSQWSRLGLEKVDFGMGKPVHVGPICCDRYCLFLPVKDERDAVKVTVALPTSAVDHYHYFLRASHL